VTTTRSKSPTRLTSAAIDSLPPGDHNDPTARLGLQLRVREKAAGTSRTWFMRYRWGESHGRIVIGHWPSTTLADARAEVQRLRGEMDKGIDPKRARPTRRSATTKAQGAPPASGRDSRQTIEFLASEFMERYVRPKRKRPEYAQAILDRDVLPAWRARDARSIKPREVIELLDSIVDRGSPVTANRTAALLSQMFRFGVHRTIVETSPVQLLMRPGGKEKQRARILTDDELRIFLTDPRAATRFERLEHVMLILLLTGQRRGELALARWKDVDLKAGAWTIPPENSKTGRGHVVPLTPRAVREFRVLKNAAGKSPHVLPAVDAARPLDPKQLTRSLAKCRERMKKLGIAEFTLHDLRRTCRTGLARLKVPPHIAERVLNHAPEKIPGTYDVHDYLEEKRDALDKWAKHLKGLAG
jgi:integrase